MFKWKKRLIKSGKTLQMDDTRKNTHLIPSYL